MKAEIDLKVNNANKETFLEKWNICPKAKECDGAKNPKEFWEKCCGNYHSYNCKPYIEVK